MITLSLVVTNTNNTATMLLDAHTASPCEGLESKNRETCPGLLRSGWKCREIINPEVADNFQVTNLYYCVVLILP